LWPCSISASRTVIRVGPDGAVPQVYFGKKRKCPGSRGTSVLPSGADIVSLPRHVRLVPRVDIREMKEFANWQDGRPPDCAL